MTMKTKTRHTPGPWFAGLGWVYAGDRKTTIAGKGSTPETIEQDEANLQLIAAAPDLLKWLKVAEKFYTEELEDLGECDHSVSICYCVLREDLQSIREVISKAEGTE